MKKTHDFHAVECRDDSRTKPNAARVFKLSLKSN